MDINKIGNSFQAKISSTAKADDDNKFNQIFNQKLDEINRSGSPGAVDSKNDVILKGEKIINLLDHYAGELADPNRTLKDIRPLVDSIEKEVGLMESEALTKVGDDKSLDRILKDLTVTAKVAMYKFHRGDYI